jgi:transposase
MSAYSVDLRRSLIRAWKTKKHTYEELAELFHVGRASVSRWISRYRRTRRVEPSPHGGGNPSRIPKDKNKVVLEILKERPDVTLEELAREYTKRTKISTSHSGVSRALKRMGITRKKSLSSPRSATGRRSRSGGGISSPGS